MKEYDFQLSSFDIFNITKEMGNETVNNEKNRINPKESDFFETKDEKKIIDNYVNVVDLNIEYKKELLKNAKNKIWNVIKRMKNDDLYKNSNLIKEKWYIVNPSNSKFRFYFNIIFYIVFYIDIILTPLEIVYQFDNYIYREICFDIFFIFDVCLNFFTSYYDYEIRYYITDTKRIVIHYLKNGFPFDLFTVFPFYVFNKKLSIFRLIKLYRYSTFNEKLKKYLSFLFKLCIRNTTYVNQIVRVISFFLSLCYILHVCACCYTYLGIKFGNSWIYYHQDLLNTKNLLDIYISSVYFMAETFSTTGYGDLTPNLINEPELLFIIICEIINCGLFAYLISNILDIFTSGDNSLRKNYRNEELNLQKWINYYIKRLPSSSKKTNIHRDEIWDDVKRYFGIYYSIEKNFSWISQYSLIKEMKPNHKNLIFEHVFLKVYKKYEKFFKNIYINRTKHEIILNLKTNIETSDTVLISKGQRINKLYFIEQGEVLILNSNITKYQKEHIVNILKEGDFFGLEGLVPRNKDRISNYKYIVPKYKEFIVFYSINLDFLLKEILSYDGETYNILITLARYYREEVLGEIIPNEEIRKIDYNFDKLTVGCHLMDKLDNVQRYEHLIQKLNDKISILKKEINKLKVKNLKPKH